MKARDLMTPNPMVVTAGEPVSQAAKLMRDHNIGLVPVVDDRATMHLRGVLTDRDIVVRCVAERHLSDCRVAEHMTPMPLDSVSPDSDIRRVVEMMEDDQVRRVMVTENGRLVGIIATADLALKEGPMAPLLVEEVLEKVSEPIPVIR